MGSLPFPSNENPFPTSLTAVREDKVPWTRVKANEPPPVMFRLCFCDGRVVSYAYSDLRETRLLHAGHLTLCLLGMEKYHVVIQGRRLSDLADLFSAGKVKSIVELGPRTFDRSEAAPSIDKITIEALTGHNL
jgi:hypothetical protein